MPFSFPANPAIGDTSLQNGRQYIWNGTAWDFSSGVASHKSTHATGGADALSPSDIGAQKTITSGTAIPTGGSSGDIYLRYT